MSGLPAGWVSAEIKDLASIKLGKMLDKTKNKGEPQPYLRNINVRWGEFDLSDILTMRFTDDELPTFEIRDGDLIVCEGGEPGRCAVWNDGPTALKYQKALLRARFADGVHPVLLALYMRLLADSGQLQNHFTGTTIKHLPHAAFERITVPLPPQQEQRRIVAKLDSLRARSSRARNELDHIPKLIERYKQAILSKAFSGELIGLTPAPSQYPHDSCWHLPATWQWVRFDQAAEVASNLVPTSEAQKLPHIAPDNIGAGTGKLLPFKTVAEDGVKSPKHRFYPGQVLYSKIRPYLRKAVLINFDGVCSADMYPLNARSGVMPQYLHYWTFSSQLADFVVDHEGRTVLPKVNQVGLNQTPFPLPPEPDQKATVKLLDAAFAWLDKIATEHARAEHLLPKLDQAILAKAFRGELVPQDPNDEPASALLERMKAEREGGEQPRRRAAKA